MSALRQGLGLPRRIQCLPCLVGCARRMARAGRGRPLLRFLCRPVKWVGRTLSGLHVRLGLAGFFQELGFFENGNLN